MIASTWARAALLGAVTAVVGCSAGGRGHPEQGDAPPGTLTPAQRARLELAPVAPSTFRPTTEVTGTVAFNGDISTQVISAISGPVTRILVEPGARVTPGQALALVSSPDYAADVATYRKAEATAANLQRIADLDVQLFKNDALARREMEQAETDAATAAADREAALEQLRALGVDSAGIDAIKQHRAVAAGPQGVVRAPIAGTVVERLVTAGQLLQAGTTPCFTIAGLSSVWVMAHVFEAELPDVAVGDSADVRLTDDTTRVYRGRVTYVGALVNPDTRATDVRVLTVNPGEALKRDMFVRVAIRAARARTGLLVPTSAVLRDAQNLPFVFVTSSGGFVRKPVQLGGHVGSSLEVTGGLVPGDTLIVQGGLFLQFAENQ
jgi:cobalt-zinc-cadmium efflux system membrane fusion protein